MSGGEGLDGSGAARVVIDMLGGQCPVQGKGTVNGVPFYFRARGEDWSFSVGDDPVDVSCGFSEGFRYEEEYGEAPFAASWMPVEEARAFILSAAARYVVSLTPGPAASTTADSGNEQVTAVAEREGSREAIPILRPSKGG